MLDGHNSSRFIAAAFAVSDDCIKVIGLDGSLQFMNEGGQRVMEIEDFSRFKGCYWPNFGKAKAIPMLSPHWKKPAPAAPRASRALPIQPRARRAIGM